MRSFPFFSGRRYLMWGVVVITGVLAALMMTVAPERSSAKKSKCPQGSFKEKQYKGSDLSIKQFSRKYNPSREYMAGLDWDPTSARFWPEFEKSQLRLNANELSVFKTNGFVVSENLYQSTFGDIYTQIFRSDLPVFVSADSILHAWHRSYDAILEELETNHLAQQMDEMLSRMARVLPEAHREYAKPFFANHVQDADYFLTVARSLLKGAEIPCFLPGNKSGVAKTLKSINGLGLEEFEIFGETQSMDFSLFKPRGHYEKSEALRRYFRCMSWCGLVNFHLDPKDSRGLGTSIVLHDLLRRSRQFEAWSRVDHILQGFLGQPDSMTFLQLSKLLAEDHIHSPSDIKDRDRLMVIQDRIKKGSIGKEQVQGSSFSLNFPRTDNEEPPPRSFTVMGQRFVLDSWTTSQVVDEKRRIPSALDVAFSVLGNNHVTPLIVDRINDKNGRAFRDGIPYQGKLDAVRQMIDNQKEDVWSQNLYSGWLGLLRSLSAPTTDPEFPQTMRTRAWAMKTLNTQLGSWAQLRHDTILYVKQSFTIEPVCMYPTGFVEPRTDFWRRFQVMTAKAATIFDGAQLPEQASFCRRFSGTMRTLVTLSEKELAQTPFSSEEKKFLRDLLLKTTSPGICGGPGITSYTGWYPKLFYKGDFESCEWDPIVADVHTDLPYREAGDDGCVLHEAVGNVDILVIAVENGDDRAVYAGPVFSHYEFETPVGQRKTDSEWKKDIQQEKLPERPEWTRSYLVTKKNSTTQRDQRQ